MTAAVEVRPATVGDTPRLVELLMGGTLRQVEDTGDLPPYERAMEEIVADPDSCVLVAVMDGTVVGMCQLIMFRHLQERGGKCAELESVHVDAERRSAGIGGILVEAAVEEARAAGCYRVQLTSNKSRQAAHRFYLAHGFEASHEGFKRYL